MNTKSVCEQLNISPKALRVYEELGIVVPERAENNYRNYREGDVLKLRQVILLKELGIPLTNIKELLNQELNEKNKIIYSLALQLNAVENKINELENIKLTLRHTINEELNTNVDSNYNQCFVKITECFNKNKENRMKWVDKWDFDTWAKNYDKSIIYGSWDELGIFEKYDYVLSVVADRIKDSNASKLIDFGCGTGNLYGKLNFQVDYLGIDQSIEMLLQARNKYPNIKLRLGNFLDELFLENEFNVITSTYAFHHLNPSEKEKVIKLLLSYLKPGGKIIIVDLMFLNEKEKLKQRDYFCEQNRRDLWNAIQDEYYTSIEEIKTYAEYLGCAVNYEHMINFIWMVEIIK